MAASDHSTQTLTSRCRAGTHLKFKHLTDGELKMVAAVLSNSMNKTLDEKFQGRSENAQGSGNSSVPGFQNEDLDVIRSWAYVAVSKGSKFRSPEEFSECLLKTGDINQEDIDRDVVPALAKIGDLFATRGKDSVVRGYFKKMIVHRSKTHDKTCWCCYRNGDDAHLFAQFRVIPQNLVSHRTQEPGDRTTESDLLEGHDIIVIDFIENNIHTRSISCDGDVEYDFEEPRLVRKEVTLADVIRLYPNTMQIMGEKLGWDTLVRSL